MSEKKKKNWRVWHIAQARKKRQEEVEKVRMEEQQRKQQVKRDTAIIQILLPWKFVNFIHIFRYVTEPFSFINIFFVFIRLQERELKRQQAVLLKEQVRALELDNLKKKKKKKCV